MRANADRRSINRPVALVLLENEVANAIPASGTPVFVGDGDVDYVCAACAAQLCVGMRSGDLAGLAFMCGCGRSSRVPWHDALRSVVEACR